MLIIFGYIVVKKFKLKLFIGMFIGVVLCYLGI